MEQVRLDSFDGTPVEPLYVDVALWAAVVEQLERLKRVVVSDRIPGHYARLLGEHLRRIHAVPPPPDVKRMRGGEPVDVSAFRVRPTGQKAPLLDAAEHAGTLRALAEFFEAGHGVLVSRGLPLPPPEPPKPHARRSKQAVQVAKKHKPKS